MRKETCEVCKQDFKIKDLFLQWHTAYSEVYVCEDCIKKHKEYSTESCYCPDADITFIFAQARIKHEGEFIELSQTLIGYHYGEPVGNEGYARDMLKEWLVDKEAKWLRRQSFNENCKDEEVLY